MTIPVLRSYLPLGSHITGTLTDDGTAITLFGVDTPGYMSRLLIYRHYEFWATESLSSSPMAPARIIWLVDILPSTTLVKGRILETALITPADATPIHHLISRLCARIAVDD